MNLPSVRQQTYRASSLPTLTLNRPGLFGDIFMWVRPPWPTVVHLRPYTALRSVT